MNSIAILYSMKKSNAPRIGEGINAELHINYWKIPKESGKFSYISKFHIIISCKLIVYIVMCFYQETN